jgi:hypothetical protein
MQLGNKSGNASGARVDRESVCHQATDTFPHLRQQIRLQWALGHAYT